MFKKNIKRAAFLLLVAVLIMSFAACGKNDQQSIEDLSDEEVEGIFESLYNDDDSYEKNTKTNNYSFNIFAKDIDLSQYCSVTYSGLNGNAVANLNVNYDALDSLFTQDEMAKIFYKYYSSFEDNPFTEESYYSYADEWSLSALLDFDLAEYYDGLSNGDNIVVNVSSDTDTITIDNIKKYFNINFNQSFIVTVEGIKDGIPVDILSDLEQYIVYEGANGGGFAVLNIPQGYTKEENGFYITENYGFVSIVFNNEEVVNFKPDIISENNGSLKQGDIIKLSAKSYENYMEQYGAVFSPAEKDVIVPNLGNYATDISQLTQANIQDIQEAVLKDCSEYAASDDIFEKLDVYTGTLKPTEVSHTKSTFALLCAVKESSVDFWNGGYSITYRLRSVNDIEIKPDGTLSYAIGETVYETFDTLEELQTYINIDCPYSCVKIG